jgi:uncharacterized circularly permuted ATP-grasp superfamily protein/uncharacterized alpha-E superfamily protein
LRSASQPRWSDAWLNEYLEGAGLGDVLRGDYGRGARWWGQLLEGMAQLASGQLAKVQERVQRQVNDIGIAFRLPGETEERPWPASALPLLIGADEWSDIEAGIIQRAELMERLLKDVYGRQSLISGGSIPAAVVTGSRHFWRSMEGVEPPGGYRLHIYAADLGRGPDGEWRVLADHARAPVGAGYALENRLAASRVMGPLHTRLNVQRLAPFFSSFRTGLAARCKRDRPRIGLLTPGRYNSSYSEQAHLARYLGLMLVEGDDLAVRGDQLYVRTIEGLKRIDGVWRRIDTRLLDPLAFDAESAIGVPGLMDAYRSGSAVVANAPGSGVVESPALSAFLPLLARKLLGADLLLPNIATWWFGQEGPRQNALAALDDRLIGPAFADAPFALPGGEPRIGADLDAEARRRLIEDLQRRPHDYIAQEVVRLSTMPTIVEGQLVPRPFTLRAFAARDEAGQWHVMPGGFARIGERPDERAVLMGEGAFSADVCIVAKEPVETVSLLPTGVQLRRNPGTLPSRAADNLYWLGRYLERGEATLRLVRATLGGTIDVDGGATLQQPTIDRLGKLLKKGDAVEAQEWSSETTSLLALEALDGEGIGTVRSLLKTIRAIGEGIRDRLSVDVSRLIEAPLTIGDGLPARTAALIERFSALSGLAAENMGRTSGWRFHDLGRRIERGVQVCRLLRSFARETASADDLTTLLDLTDSQLSYRTRYLTGLALVPVRDLIGLDPYNPRGLAFQVVQIHDHLKALPTLRDDGMDEAQLVAAIELDAGIATARAESLGPDAVLAFENRLLSLSDAIGRRFFLQDNEVLRAGSMTLA